MPKAATTKSDLVTIDEPFDTPLSFMIVIDPEYDDSDPHK